MKLNPFCKDFGRSLSGISFGIFMMQLGWKEYPIWASMLSNIVLWYFIFFGVERFDKEYRKIL